MVEMVGKASMDKYGSYDLAHVLPLSFNDRVHFLVMRRSNGDFNIVRVPPGDKFVRGKIWGGVGSNVLERDCCTFARCVRPISLDSFNDHGGGGTFQTTPISVIAEWADDEEVCIIGSGQGKCLFVRIWDHIDENHFE
jgi:hypothetical protein